MMLSWTEIDGGKGDKGTAKVEQEASSNSAMFRIILYFIGIHNCADIERQVRTCLEITYEQGS